MYMMGEALFWLSRATATRSMTLKVRGRNRAFVNALMTQDRALLSMKTPRSLHALLTAALLAFSPSPLPAQEAPPDFKRLVAKIDLQDGDTLVFLGDSITHQCLYTQYLETYFYTRYPARRLRFHNAGVGGDRAANALARFEDDVASFQPKFVTVLLGMNDGSYNHFQQPIFEAYEKDMTTLLERLAASGAVAVPMTPTMHDARAARLGGRAQEPRDTYYNGVLAFYGAWLREQAQVRGLGFVDMWSPLNQLTLEQRKRDAGWTMIKDAVHPGPTGQVVMAVAVLEDMVERTPVSHLKLTGSGTEIIAHASHGEASDLLSEAGKITFRFKAAALPWVLSPEAAEGFALTHAARRFSSERLTAPGLRRGTYDLLIDDKTVATFDHDQLAAGVELQGNSETPQHQQALRVALLNKQRNEQAVKPMRDQWSQLKGRRSNLRKAEQANDPELAQKKEEFEKWSAEFKTKVAELIAKAREVEEQIYQTNQPVAHRYELRLRK